MNNQKYTLDTESPAAVVEARRVVKRIDAPEVEFPADKRPLGSRRVIPITREEPTCLYWDTYPNSEEPQSFRLVAGTDHRFAHRIRVGSAGTGDLYGGVDALFSSPGQLFEFELTADQAGEVMREGLSLQLEEGPPLWIVAGDAGVSDALRPHLYAGTGQPPLEHCLSMLCSDASLQPCDWMAICVLDALRDWAEKGRKDAKRALEWQLRLYFDPERGQRETIHGRPADDHAGGPESTGPFAVLAMEDPHHPALRFALEGFELSRDPERDVVGKGKVVTESVYNIAYPMMALAVHAGCPELKKRALKQLEVSKELLTTDEDVFLRYFFDTGEKTFANWSRGVAWYFLGWVRTLALLPAEERPPDLVAEAGRMAEWVTRHQQSNGLWPCFLKEAPSILPDSSGSAGIAAALSIGVREKMVDPSLLSTAVRAYEGLMLRMTHDGWLRGTSQSNKKESHGMDIQRHPFRVIAPWGMGLFGQLASALEDLGAFPVETKPENQR